MSAEIPNSFLNIAVSAARRAGDIIINNLGGLEKGDIQSKKAFDFVTKVDKASESEIIRTIRSAFPTHSFLGEESGTQTAGEEFRWIIDPLDGTTNYIHSYPMFSVSIALEQRGEIILGVVFDPLRGELFHAVNGGGAYLNGSPIHVSERTLLAESLVATGFPFRIKQMIDLYLEAFKAVFFEVSDIRRAGSAALDLCYLAAGRFEGFFELNLSPWDIAAGSLIISEAGGSVTDFGGGNRFLSTGNVVAGNKAIHSQILTKIQKVFRGVIEK